MSGAHGHGHDAGHGPENKRIALLISILALVLSISETLGKGAQTTAIDKNIEASNLWSFFQAKTIRMTVVRTAAEAAELDLNQTGKSKEAIAERIAGWRKTAERYDTEPETQEGRKELAARAKAAEKVRDRSLAAYHHYETASAALQIAIVLASAAIVTSTMLLAWLAVGLGVIGMAFGCIAFFAPLSLHLF
ncbi:MAG TPA: DUF4337 domain-containing protein [Burkholderiales bacterium]|jgi:hypothetical protein|nr:DUF4337 domain-containing protein [Burkholderiales bacterium]